MERRLLKRFKQGKKFSFVILLGGTNDIGGYSPSFHIWNTLEKLYKHIEKESAIVIPMTIPEAYWKDADYIKKRSELNTKIRERATQKQVPCVDIEKLIPFSKETGLWDDNLHFSPTGYDTLGTHIFESIKDYLTEFLK